MKHLDEHTIELYVLGDHSVNEQKRSIETHLRICAGCRELELRIKSLYSSIDEELRKSPAGFAAPERALVRTEREMDLWDSYHTAISKRPSTHATWWEETRSAIVHRPMTAAVGSIALIGVLSLVILFSATSLFKDTNPSYVHYNIGSGLIEVYNKGNTKLWEMPARDLEGAEQSDKDLRVKSSLVADLKGEGHNVVISTVRMANDDVENSLRIIDGKMNVLAHVEYGVRPVHFRDRQYDARFNPNAPTVVAAGKEKNIIVVADNGRSPTVVIRYDASGKVLGEYWHFGGFRGAYAVDLNNDGKDELVLIGSNDVGRGDADNIPTIVVLDPTKIRGETESSATRGFGFPASNAELYYVRLDLDEICSVFRSHPFIAVLLSTSENVLRFVTKATIPGATTYIPNFEFVFDKQLHAVEVKNEDQTVREVERLRARGKTSITLDSAYMDRLKHAVRYWNGIDWTKEVSKVDQGRVMK